MAELIKNRRLMQKIQKDVDLLDKELAIANTNFKILKKLAPVVKGEIKNLRQFSEFFLFDFAAHTVTLIIYLAKFFDKRGDSHSLFIILNSINDKSKRQEFEDKIKRLEKDFKFYEEMRNKIFAHMDVNVKKLHSHFQL